MTWYDNEILFVDYLRYSQNYTLNNIKDFYIIFHLIIWLSYYNKMAHIYLVFMLIKQVLNKFFFIKENA